jgi:hypothetical protein
MSITRKPSHISLHWIWFIVLIVLPDQGTKHLVVSSLEANRPMAILPSVELVLSQPRVSMDERSMHIEMFVDPREIDARRANHPKPVQPL